MTILKKKGSNEINDPLGFKPYLNGQSIHIDFLKNWFPGQVKIYENKKDSHK